MLIPVCGIGESGWSPNRPHDQKSHANGSDNISHRAGGNCYKLETAAMVDLNDDSESLAGPEEQRARLCIPTTLHESGINPTV